MWNSILSGLLEGTVYAGIITVIMTVFFVYGPSFEYEYMPVIKNFKATMVQQTPDYKVYDVSFEKIRSCDIDLPTSSWYVLNERNELDRVKLVLPPRNGDPTRPTGKNISRGWKVYTPAGMYVRSQTFVIYHFCHPGWKTRTEAIITTQ